MDIYGSLLVAGFWLLVGAVVGSVLVRFLMRAGAKTQHVGVDSPETRARNRAGGHASGWANLDEILRDHDDRIEAAIQNAARANDRCHELEKRTAAPAGLDLGAAVHRLETALAGVIREQGEHGGRIQALEPSLDRIPELFEEKRSLGSRVGRLADGIAAVDSNLEGMRAEHEARLAELRAVVDTQHKAIARLQKDLSGKLPTVQKIARAGRELAEIRNGLEQLADNARAAIRAEVAGELRAFNNNAGNLNHIQESTAARVDALEERLSRIVDETANVRQVDALDQRAGELEGRIYDLERNGR